jgi:signal peptidase II
MIRRILYFLLCLLVFASDRILKSFIKMHVAPYPHEGIPIFQDWFGGISFSINHVTNTGAAWGVLSTFDKALLVLRVALIVGIAIYLFTLNKRKERELPFALILTGAIGNVFDHFVYGHVIDMFHFSFWGYSFAVFNIADAAIFCGVVLMFLIPYLIKCSESQAQKKKA